MARFRTPTRAALRAAVLLVTPLLVAGSPARAATVFLVDPEAGSSTLTAVFDASVGERITAVSSQIGCTLEVDEAKLTGKARCSVPLKSIMVDNDATKSEHFAQWATNKKVEPEKCTLDVTIPEVALKPPVEAKQPVAFTTQGTFTICGRARDDKGSERITGTIVYLPPGSHGPSQTLRIRAHLEGFDRERYGVSPKNTAGWLARVQQLADVVATEGVIDINAFASASNAPAK
jgi:hypothetical protein